jgi:hypothetical protein
MNCVKTDSWTFGKLGKSRNSVKFGANLEHIINFTEVQIISIYVFIIPIFMRSPNSYHKYSFFIIKIPFKPSLCKLASIPVWL